MKKKVGYLDREWGRCKSKTVEGDMGFTFCDMSDTLSDDVDRLRENVVNWINGPDCELENETYDEEYQMFAIYLLYEAEVDLEEGEDLLWTEIRHYEAVLTGVYACAPKEIAGWIEDDGEYKKNGVTVKYREV